MKESEENLNSDFDLKVKHDISERLKAEPPALASPSPILSATCKRKSLLPITILSISLITSIIINIVLATLFFSANSKISALEKEIVEYNETISDLRSRLIETYEK